MGVTISKDGVKLPNLVSRQALNKNARAKTKSKTMSYLTLKTYRKDTQLFEGDDDWRLTQIVDAKFYFKPNMKAKKKSSVSFHSMKTSTSHESIIKDANKKAIEYIELTQERRVPRQDKYYRSRHNKTKDETDLETKHYVRHQTMNKYTSSDDDRVVMPSVQCSQESMTTNRNNETSFLDSHEGSAGETYYQRKTVDNNLDKIEGRSNKRAKTVEHSNYANYNDDSERNSNRRYMSKKLSEETIIPVI